MNEQEDPIGTRASDRESSPEDEDPPDSDDHGPYVCPTCYSVASSCAPGCTEDRCREAPDSFRATLADTLLSEAHSSDREAEEDWGF